MYLWMFLWKSVSDVPWMLRAENDNLVTDPRQTDPIALPNRPCTRDSWKVREDLHPTQRTALGKWFRWAQALECLRRRRRPVPRTCARKRAPDSRANRQPDCRLRRHGLDWCRLR